MKRLLTISAIMLGTAAFAQTYPKYTNEAGGNTNTVKPAKKPKTEEVQAPKTDVPPGSYREIKIGNSSKSKFVAEEPSNRTTGDFQEIMERAVVQSKMKNYNAAISLYTQALNVANEEQAWRALVSRATTYEIMDKPDLNKAIKDLTDIIDTRKTPQKQLAYIYTCRGRMLQEKGDIAGGCADAKKARELGLPEALMAGLENCI